MESLLFIFDILLVTWLIWKLVRARKTPERSLGLFDWRGRMQPPTKEKSDA